MPAGEEPAPEQRAPRELGSVYVASRQTETSRLETETSSESSEAEVSGLEVTGQGVVELLPELDVSGLDVTGHGVVLPEDEPEAIARSAAVATTNVAAIMRLRSIESFMGAVRNRVRVGVRAKSRSVDGHVASAWLV